VNEFYVFSRNLYILLMNYQPRIADIIINGDIYVESMSRTIRINRSGHTIQLCRWKFHTKKLCSRRYSIEFDFY